MLALAGCTGTVSDDVSLEAVQTRGEGIVIVAAKFPGRQICSSLVLEVSRKVDGKRRIEAFTASDLFRGDSPAQAKLKAGDYELSNMVCHSGNRQIMLHKRPNIFNAHKAGPPPVYGRFSVAPGEVVNIGQVSIKWAVAGIAELSVSNLSADHHAWLRKNRPNLSKRMVMRLMKPNRYTVLKRKRQ